MPFAILFCVNAYVLYSIYLLAFFWTDDHRGSLWVRLPLSISHDSMRHSPYIPDVGCSSQFEWCVGVWVCMFEWTNEWVIVWNECVCFFLYIKKKPTQWSYLIWSEFGPALIGNDRKFACEPSWRWAAGESTNSRASTLYVVVRGDELIRYTSSMWVWVDLKSHGGQWV